MTAGAAPPAGRWAQRERTRQALLAAAGELVAGGEIPTVLQAAELAGISRATAYRYFPNQESMLVEVSLPFAQDLSAAFVEARTETEPAARIGVVVRAAAQWCYDHQAVMREMLRASLEVRQSGYQRPSHRRDWIDEALAPLRDELDDRDYRRLSSVLSLFIGIDSIVVMDTINELPRDEAVDALVWGAMALVGAARGGTA